MLRMGKKETVVTVFTRLGLVLFTVAATGCVPTAAGPSLPCDAKPSPGVCCEILWGSLHGTVTDTRGQPQSGVTVTLRTKTGAPLGNCDRQISMVTDDEGKYGFNVVPFDTPLEVIAASPTKGAQTQAVTVVRGPMVFLDFTF
jgi:hypothetical protein